MEVTRPPTERSKTEASPALLAKGALRRLAAERMEPTPDNYARAYRQEAGDPSVAGALPARAQHLVERLAARAFEAEPRQAAAGFVLAMNHAHWDEAERVLDQVASPAADALAVLLERIVRGMERNGQHWTADRRKAGIQRVLDASRTEPRHLQQRLTRLLASWESDSTSGMAALEEGDAATRPPAGIAPDGAAPGAAPPEASQSGGAQARGPSPLESMRAGSIPAAGWHRVVAALSTVLQQTLPGLDGANRELRRSCRPRAAASSPKARAMRLSSSSRHSACRPDVCCSIASISFSSSAS